MLESLGKTNREELNIYIYREFEAIYYNIIEIAI
jgi:hypothetical protein